MNPKAILFSLMLFLTLFITGCSSSQTVSDNTANINANTAIVVSTNNINATANLQASSAETVKGNSNIPGIPNVPGTDKPISKEDPTRSAKIQAISRPAPDNSEITTTLGQDVVETRVFKNNAQIAKIEKTQDTKNSKTTVKVYLRNGQVRELAEGKVGDAMSESANNILKVLAGGVAQTKPEGKADAAPTETTETQKKQ